MSLSDRFISGTSIRWGRLAQTGVAAVAVVVIDFWIGLVDLIGGGIQTAQSGLTEFYLAYVGSIIGIPIATIDAAVDQLLGSLSIFGPFALPIGMVVVMLTGYLLAIVLVRGGQIVIRGVINA